MNCQSHLVHNLHHAGCVWSILSQHIPTVDGWWWCSFFKSGDSGDAILDVVFGQRKGEISCHIQIKLRWSICGQSMAGTMAKLVTTTAVEWHDFQTSHLGSTQNSVNLNYLIDSITKRNTNMQQFWGESSDLENHFRLFIGSLSHLKSLVFQVDRRTVVRKPKVIAFKEWPKISTATKR